MGNRPPPPNSLTPPRHPDDHHPSTAPPPALHTEKDEGGPILPKKEGDLRLSLRRRGGGVEVGWKSKGGEGARRGREGVCLPLQPHATNNDSRTGGPQGVSQEAQCAFNGSMIRWILRFALS